MPTTVRSDEHNLPTDDNEADVLRFMALDTRRGDMSPLQVWQCDRWLQRRIAVVREAKIANPLQPSDVHRAMGWVSYHQQRKLREQSP